MNTITCLLLIWAVPLLVLSANLQGTSNLGSTAQELNLDTDCRNTTIKQCIKRPGAMYKCMSNYSQGCICYKNGTCSEGLVNSCIQCQQDDVVAVESDTKCPCPGVTANSDCIKQKIDSCPQYPPGIMINCLTDEWMGCVCYKNGTCVEKMMNTCVACRTEEGVVAAQNNTKCPCPGYQ
mmetsp:Transcript_27168/g.31336  ORF Transcript_27168/g.31336 Transcript_27168/m.31336 type:complete len:179 (+) Transcript_27168:57-593(+)